MEQTKKWQEDENDQETGREIDQTEDEERISKMLELESKGSYVNELVFQIILGFISNQCPLLKQRKVCLKLS